MAPWSLAARDASSAMVMRGRPRDSPGIGINDNDQDTQHRGDLRPFPDHRQPQAARRAQLAALMSVAARLA
jgi:hypothetical protein